MALHFLLFLAVVQGLTEFLPVSSSGHLALFQHFFGMPTDGGATLEVVLHGGTMFSVLWFYRKKIATLTVGLVRRDAASWRYALCVVLASVPVAAAYFLMGDWLESTFDKPMLIAGLLLVTGALLLSLRFLKAAPHPLDFGRAFLIGIAQAFAILPGISRSGSTITAGRWLGLKDSDAMEFSFLMSLPALGGAIVLKLSELASQSLSLQQWLCLALAAVVSAVVGLLALSFLRYCQFLGRFWMFSIYCLAAGGLSLLVMLIRG